MPFLKKATLEQHKSLSCALGQFHIYSICKICQAEFGVTSVGDYLFALGLLCKIIQGVRVVLHFRLA